MKAFLCKEFGPVDSHQVEEIDEPIAGPGQVVVDIKATGFLYGMVRLIVGQLVLVGEKKITPHIFTDRWRYKKKNDVCESAPAKGLCFVNASYDEEVFKNINKKDLFPKFILEGYS